MSGNGTTKVGAIRCAVTALGLLQLAGCGTYVPHMQEFWETSSFAGLDAGGVLEYNIRDKVYCDILGAVEFVESTYCPQGGLSKQRWISKSLRLGP
jgi:hypothetical protein